MRYRRCVNCRGGFKKGVKCLFKFSHFQMVVMGAFLGSLSNVMMVNFPNYFLQVFFSNSNSIILCCGTHG